MKKLVMFAAVAVMSVVASATNVKWGLSGASTDITSGKIYLVYGAVASSVWGSADNFSESTITSNGGTIVDTGDLSSGAYFNNTGVNVTPTSLGVTKGQNPLYVVLISSDGSTAQVSSTVNVNIQPSALSANPSWATSTLTKYAATVPEPTSALLMVLGVAGLALKRKRA